MQLRGNNFLRFLDRYLGVPLLYACAFLKRTRQAPTQVATIGVLKLAGIGDLILLSGVIQDLRNYYPAAKIILFCGKDNVAAASLIPHVTSVEELSVFNPVKALRSLRKTKLSLLLDFGQWSRIDALLTFFSGARFIVGFQTPGQGRHLGYDSTALHSRNHHETVNYQNLLRALDIPVGALPSIEYQLEKPPVLTPYVIFHPWPSGLRSELKEWPLDNWIELGKWCKTRGLEVFITGSHADAPRSTSLAGQIGSKSLAGTPLVKQPSILAQAACTVSVNTGIMHLAACLPRPLIALHGPTSPERWGPLSPQALSLISDHPDSGYLHLGFEYPANPPPCMESLPLSKVIAALSQILCGE